MANMQLSKDNDKLLTNAEPVRQQFGIADMGIVINLLTKMYPNPIRTLTQEYISNARDANREVGNKRRIEITSPTRFNPLMIIRDFGPGLSPDRIENVFLLYGASTKRTSNSQTGGFGIGAKSGWAYTDSFNIITYVDGIKRTYIAHKSHGSGNLDKISEENTTEPNGTEIQISVSPMDVSKFKDAILRATFFWSDHEMPIFKGIDKAEKPERKILFKIDNYEVLQIPNFVGQEKSYIVVDGIPYPNRDYSPEVSKKSKLGFTIAIPNGKVNIAPNREEFISDDITKQFLSACDKSIAAKIKSHVDSKINTNTALNDALRECVELYKMFEFDFKFKNYTMWYNQLSVVNSAGQALNLGVSYEYRRGNKLHRKDTLTSIQVSDIDKLYINDLPNEPATKVVWRIKKLLTGPVRHLNILKGDIDSDIIADLKPIPLSTVDATDYKQFRAQRLAVKKQEICLHYFKYNNLKPTQVTIANVSKTIVYDLFGEDTYNRRNSDMVKEWINVMVKQDIELAFIAKGSERMIANNAHFIKFKDFVKQYKPVDKDIIGMVKKEIAEHDNIYNIRKFGNLASEIKDESFAYILEMYNRKDSDYATIPKAIYDTLQDHKIIKEFKKHSKFLDQFEAKYPLISDIESDKLNKAVIKKEVIAYINSKV